MLIVGACIARPLRGNRFFLSKTGVIGILGFCGRPMVAPTTVKDRLVGNCSDSPCGCQFHVVHDVEKGRTHGSAPTVLRIGW